MTTMMTALAADIIHEMPGLGQAFQCFISFDEEFGNGKIWHKEIISIIEVKTKKIISH